MPAIRIQQLLPLVAALACGTALGPDQRVLGSVPMVKAIYGSSVHDELVKAEIIPQVIDDFDPAFLLHAEWSSKTRAELGNAVRPDKLQAQPTIALTPVATTKASSPQHRRDSLEVTGVEQCPGADAKSNMTYAIVLTDPDAPSHQDNKWSEFCHWIATGRVAVELKPPRAQQQGEDGESERDCPQLSLTGLEDVVPYKPPGPPEKTGRHRYIFFAFTPINATTVPLNVTKPGERKRWGTDKPGSGVRQWAEENGLAPIAANFIYAQNDKQ
ncbi:lipid binding protein [Magnaporthiopsis poae ATCC 64411]|uniref:Lipid binding protein n=1 Tax=Magnaporthiopsis poae (strain ATCC 64411 / 73-15) TaxID=644358 RepID=A0A0C4E466_MAGP6|nr:lipid binding protein [Magnaporthiopsis poae ATCC 64411]